MARQGVMEQQMCLSGKSINKGKILLPWYIKIYIYFFKHKGYETMLKKIFLLAAGVSLLNACNSGSGPTSTADLNVVTTSGTSVELPTATPEAVGMNSSKLALIDALINNDIKNGFPGAAIVIVKDGKIVKQSIYGYKLKYDESGNELNQFVPLESNTIFDLASNSKMYATNYAIMHLVYEGKIDLNAPLKQYLPEYTGCDENGQCRDDRKVIDFLEHDAGYTADPQFFNPYTIGWDLYSQDRDRTQMLLTTRLPFERPLGGAPVYSDADFMLLGMLIERVTGQREDIYVENTFYKPLGLTRTVFQPELHGFAVSDCAATEINGNTRGFTVSFPNIRTTPIQCQAHDEKAYYSMGGVSGHAGLFSTLHDMAILTQLMLNDGNYGGIQFWNQAVESEFTAPNPYDQSFGLGWRRAGEPESRTQKWFSPYASNQAVGHTGWIGTATVIDPKYNLAIVLLTNKRHSPYINGNFEDSSQVTGNYTKVITTVYQAINEIESTVK